MDDMMEVTCEEPVPAERDEEEIVVTKELIEAFLEDFAHLGRSPESVKSYRTRLETLYNMLPEDKRIRRNTLATWRMELLVRGYAPSTVNLSISATNSFVAWLGKREFQLSGTLERVPEKQPELSRAEYLRLLQTARMLNKRRLYLLIKTIALMGLSVDEIFSLTVESIQDGYVELSKDRGRRTIPSFFQEELQEYVKDMGITQGPVFVTRNGRRMSRSAVFSMIRGLSREAHVEEEKCTPRCLQKLWRTTREQLQANIARMMEQTYERLLETEQLTVGWEEESPEQ
ncbi:MAG: tyrosine-type recombinase/integrase [Acutalibacter sp.]|jgi:integrase